MLAIFFHIQIYTLKLIENKSNAQKILSLYVSSMKQKLSIHSEINLKVMTIPVSPLE